MNSRLFPVFLKMKGRNCLVLGGGVVASRKIEMLLKCDARVTVAAPELEPSLRAKAHDGEILWQNKDFSLFDLHRYHLVIAATDDAEFNQSVARQCERLKILVNVVDSQEHGSFFTSAIVDRFPVQIAISTSGASPLLAGLLRVFLETQIPRSVGVLASFLERRREEVKRALSDPAQKRRFWHRVLESPIVDALKKGDDRFAGQEFDKLLGMATNSAEGSASDDSGPRPVGEVHLIGCGPGDAELLTLKALRLMQNADVIVYDRLVSNEVLNMARKDALRIFVGKQCGRHSIKQAEINQILIDHARAGSRVARLKGGDPFLFGRGGEEMEALLEAGIPFQIVPGITAALGCAAYAGIPLTHRDLAHSVTFMTGHQVQSMAKLNPLSDYSESTIAIYMGLTQLKELKAKLVGAGVSCSTPVALIHAGTTADQQIVTGVLEELPGLAEQARLSSPVLAVIGNVVRFHQSVAASGLMRTADVSGHEEPTANFGQEPGRTRLFAWAE